MKRIIIAPYFMHKDLLLLLRKDAFFKQVKILTREDLLSQVYGDFSLESRIELIKELNITYDLADEIVSFFPYIYEGKCQKIIDLLPIKDRLIKEGHYTRNHLLNVAFKNSEITLYGYSKKDTTLLETLKRINVPYEFVTNKSDTPYMDVYHFDKVEDEVLYTLNKICSLIKEGVSPSDIYLYNVDETYSYYLEMYMDSFNLKINGLKTSNMYLSGYSSEFFKLYASNKDITKSLEILEEEVGKDYGEDYQFEEFKEIIKAYTYENISYEIQKDILISILKRKTLKGIYYKNGIKIINEPIASENKYIFIMNFALNIIPRVYKDDEYLSNKEKEGTFLLTSSEKNAIEKDLTLQFLNSKNTFYYLYSDRTITTDYYPSYLISNPKKQLIKTTLDEEAFSQKMLDYHLSQRIDLFFKYQEISKELLALKDASDIDKIHAQYDNSFTGVNAVKKNDDFTHSFSSIDSYYGCPFKYYLSHILKFEEYSQSFDAIAGEIAHKTLEGVYEKGYDLDKRYQEVIKEYTLSPLESIHLDAIKKHLDKMYELLIEYYNQNPDHRSVYYEKSMTLSLDKHAKLYGKIDKILKLDTEHYLIIDYKSSSHTFNNRYLEFGIGMQLPIYYALASQFPELSEDKVAGVYYHQFMDKNYNPFLEEEDYPDYLKLEGITIVDNINFNVLDSSLSAPNDKSNFFKGLSITKEGQESYTNGHAATYQEINTYRDYVINKILEADDNIRHNQFDIRPYFIDDFNSGCGFCKYRDICYLRKKQIFYPEKELKARDGIVDDNEKEEEEDVFEA